MKAVGHKTLINLFRCHSDFKGNVTLTVSSRLPSRFLKSGRRIQRHALSLGWFVQLNMWDFHCMEHTAQCVVVAPTVPNTEQQVDAKHRRPPCRATLQRKWKTRSSLFHFLVEYETGLHGLFHYSDLSLHRFYTHVNTSDPPLLSPCSNFFSLFFFFSKARLAMNNWTVQQSKCHSREKVFALLVIRISLFVM